MFDKYLMSDDAFFLMLWEKKIHLKVSWGEPYSLGLKFSLK